MVYSRILGTGSYLPANVVTNAMLAERVETSDEWIVSRTGIRARHIAAEDEKTSDLALQAARAAIADAGLVPEDIDLIIVATTTPDMVFPSTACLLQEKLGVHGCPAFDVQAVCAGFMYALVTANNYIKAGMAKKALVVGAEIISRILDWEDRRTCVLFGDGAGAVVLGASDQPGIEHACMAADGRYNKILNTPAQISGGKIQGLPFLNMDGPAVFKFAVKALSEIATTTLSQAGVSQDQVDWLVPHQANLRIIESTAKHLGLSMERVVVTLPTHGNTSAASIPLALDQAVRDGRIRRGQRVLLEGIGGGFAWGAVLLTF
ncbi:MULTISPECIES: beta-ketoacyl-ACP synthase III [unclassified Paludibacterium]|uniref:beta-ketoacyl-ACP synthase III n=1 Tax=unclassified Paludibacterium TaxID=2618429 RepID=UPI001C056309|nr:beta-ketoacyl-ACP synthase III [Paludibacterium sp. B53371]BEV71851.1 ketoacyl-ACP synthase III [Paludibacterium sp. THUN1379]